MVVMPHGGPEVRDIYDFDLVGQAMAAQGWLVLHLTNSAFAVGLAFGAVNTFLFARSIKAIPLSVAYPVFTGASFAVITLAAALAFHERLPPIHLLGIGLVITGIVLVTR